MSEFIKTFNWDKKQIDFSDRKTAAEFLPIELHHKSDGDINNNPSFVFVMALPNESIQVYGQISLRELSEALSEIGYDLKPIDSFGE